MTNPNNVIFSIPFLIFTNTALAGEAIIFDHSELIAYQQEGALAGYYNARDNRRSCTFAFFNIGDDTISSRDSPY